VFFLAFKKEDGEMEQGVFLLLSPGNFIPVGCLQNGVERICGTEKISQSLCEEALQGIVYCPANCFLGDPEALYEDFEIRITECSG
jgi:hypothetical protein